MAVSVVVAVGDVADGLVDAIAARARLIHVGPATDRSAQMGPVISAAQRDRIAGLIGTGADEGADLVVDGRGVTVDGHDGGFWVGPTLFDRVRPHHTIYTEEIFGPVLSVLRVPTFDEALTVVNDNPYGNGSAVFTRDGGLARRFQLEVQAGAVGVNVPIPIPVAYHSFGGWKDSIFAEHSVYGTDGIAFCTRPKVVSSRWPEPAEQGVELGFPTIAR
jgi:malonate-semialdehyde dehydrogenase (acetylating)/methylmalonate-semialdehyde dehydrogenase